MTNFLPIILMIVIFPCSSAFAGNGGGGEVGNGGDSYSIQFIQTANRLAEYLLFLSEENRHGVDPKGLTETIFSVTVNSTDERLMLNGATVDAINYPDQKRIIFNRQSWDAMNAEQRQILSLHEYFGILRLQDTRYEISRPLVTEKIQLVNLCEADIGRFEKDTIQFFLTKGHVIERKVGNRTRSLTGASLYTVRGYAFRWDTNSASRAEVNALYRVGECNPHTGQYEHLQFSASGAGFSACR